jgi:hypothetical protein
MTFEELKNYAIVVCEDFPHRSADVLDIMEGCKETIESFDSSDPDYAATVQTELRVAELNIQDVVNEEEPDDHEEPDYDEQG